MLLTNTLFLYFSMGTATFWSGYSFQILLSSKKWLRTPQVWNPAWNHQHIFSEYSRNVIKPEGKVKNLYFLQWKTHSGRTYCSVKHNTFLGHQLVRDLGIELSHMDTEMNQSNLFSSRNIMFNMHCSKEWIKSRRTLHLKNKELSHLWTPETGARNLSQKQTAMFASTSASASTRSITSMIQ